jgi:TatD DNase family protein
MIDGIIREKVNNDRAVYQPNLIRSVPRVKFFDSHCHFDFAEFDSSREFIWRNAQEKGIQQLLIPAVSPDTWETARHVAEKNHGIYWAAGLHPWWIEKFLSVTDWQSELTKKLCDALKDRHCVAIGETGLDAMIATPIDIQINAFKVHLDIATQFAKPLVIHSRKTHAELIAILKHSRDFSGGVVHAFSGSYEQAKSLIDIGLYLGIGGVITYERAHKTREAVKKIPLEYLLLETDAPDMPLQGEQGKMNSPVNIDRIANHLAELKQQPLDTIARVTTENANRLFGITNAV